VTQGSSGLGCGKERHEKRSISPKGTLPAVCGIKDPRFVRDTAQRSPAGRPFRNPSFRSNQKLENNSTGRATHGGYPERGYWLSKDETADQSLNPEIVTAHGLPGFERSDSLPQCRRHWPTTGVAIVTQHTIVGTGVVGGGYRYGKSCGSPLKRGSQAAACRTDDGVCPCLHTRTTVRHPPPFPSNTHTLAKSRGSSPPCPQSHWGSTATESGGLRPSQRHGSFAHCS